MTINVEGNTTKASKGVIVTYACSPTGNTMREGRGLWKDSGKTG